MAKEFEIVRVKNRFENDDVEVVSPERIHAEFYAVESLGAETDGSSDKKSEKMYRDILINLRPRGSEESRGTCHGKKRSPRLVKPTAATPQTLTFRLLTRSASQTICLTRRL